jgi:hypothetical protein
MGLLIPQVGESDYPTSVANSFDTIDDHDHASGNGVQIPTGGLADSAVTTAKIADNNVTTAKILNANVTRPKLAAVGQQVSSACGLFTATNTAAWTDVTSLSCSITVTGRPVFIGLIADEAQAGSDEAAVNAVRTGGATAPFGKVQVLRDSTSLGELSFGAADATAWTGPPGMIWAIDVPAAGTYTYKLQARPFTASEVQVNNCKLIVYEIA